jgi:hypothetical protein
MTSLKAVGLCLYQPGDNTGQKTLFLHPWKLHVPKTCRPPQCGILHKKRLPSFLVESIVKSLDLLVIVPKGALKPSILIQIVYGRASHNKTNLNL